MSDNRLERTTELVKQVFRETWDDFYAWNDQYCRGVLESLRTKTPRDPKPLPGPLLPETDQFPARNDEDEDDDFEGIIVEDAWGNKTSYTFETVECNIDILDWVPEYESYAPTNRSIMHGDDAELLKFMPFYDDPTFDREAYEAEFAGYEWLESNHDPDLEIIVLETAQRLVSRYQIPLHHIEETDVLPLRLFTTNHIPGVLATSKRRDFPPFPLTPGALPSSQDRRQDSPKVVMQNLAKYFCPNPNCIIGYCSVHMGEIPPLQPVSPLLSNAELVNSVDEPCSDECFLHGHDQEPPSFYWSREDKEILEIILSSSPDTIPCDLAIICRKPCIETYWYRIRLLGSKIPEKKTSKKRSRQPSRASSTTSEMNDEADLNALVPDADPETNVNARILRTRVQRPAPPVYEDNQPGYTPGGPCSHQGPCDSTISPPCACVENKAHCENWCRCSPACQRRWSGCQCAQSKYRGSNNGTKKPRNTCRTARCPCFAVGRECNPELCLKCEARDYAAGICRNNGLQHELKKLTEIRPSQYGFGLFALEKIEPHELIDEYTGELIYEPTTRSRDILAHHRGRSYLFSLNGTLSIDATTVGNESRFINHDSALQNCYAQVKLVNGEHRIGIYAKGVIEPGQELFLDYGEYFWRNGAAPEEEEASRAT